MLEGIGVEGEIGFVSRFQITIAPAATGYRCSLQRNRGRQLLTHGRKPGQRTDCEKAAATPPEQRWPPELLMSPGEYAELALPPVTHHLMPSNSVYNELVSAN